MTPSLFLRMSALALSTAVTLGILAGVVSIAEPDQQRLHASQSPPHLLAAALPASAAR